MKKLIQLLILLTTIISCSVYAETIEENNGGADSDNHFAAVATQACPEMIQQSLFEQHSWAAALIPQKGNPGFYQLKLQGVRGHLMYFSEQPFRMGRMNNIRFYNLWIKANKENPKLTFKGYMEGTSSNAENYIFQLSNPTYQGITVSFQAKLMKPAEVKSTIHLTDVTLLIQVPECASCTDFPCLGC